MDLNKRYRDFDLKFQAHPVTGDLVMKTGEAAIKQSVKTLILAEFYEFDRFHPEKGGRLKGLLFENASPIISGMIAEEIRSIIDKYEPRIEIEYLEVLLDDEQNRYDVYFTFKILGSIDPLELSFYLERTQ